MNSLVSIDICASKLISSFLLYEFKDDEGAACRERAGKTSRHYSLWECSHKTATYHLHIN